MDNLLWVEVYSSVETAQFGCYCPSFCYRSQNIGLLLRDQVQSYPIYCKSTKEHLLLVRDDIAVIIRDDATLAVRNWQWSVS